ncbi:39724_t:CDS:2, partial [Gigaspora margarita]
MSSSEKNVSASTSIIEKDRKYPGSRPDEKERYKATCNFCGISWNCDEPNKLESHLANHCSKADSTTIRYFLSKILSDNSEKNKSNKKKILKETNLFYKPPTCQFLSDHLLEQQLAFINQKTNNIFQQYSNLTL